MKEFTFIHAADLHLGSPFKGLKDVNEALSKSMVKSTYLAFDRMIELAIENKVDFLLLSGDLVDAEDRNLRALLHLKRGFERLKEASIRVFLVHGNHDPLGKVARVISFPENVTTFPSKSSPWQRFITSTGAKVVLWGMSFEERVEKRNLASFVPEIPEWSRQYFKIGLLHCSIGKNPNHEPYAQCTLEDLVSKNVDYWALGHIHKKQILSKRPVVIYPGNIQGRSFKEQGRRGCYLVHVGGSGEVELNFCGTSQVVWLDIDIDVTGCQMMQEVEERAFEAISEAAKKAWSNGLICRVNLKGEWSVSSGFLDDAAKEDLMIDLNEAFHWGEDRVSVQNLRDFTTKPINPDVRSQGDDLVAYVFKEAERFTDGEDDEIYSELFQVLAPLLKHRTFRKHCKNFGKEEVKQLLNEAAIRLAARLDSKSG